MVYLLCNYYLIFCLKEYEHSCNNVRNINVKHLENLDTFNNTFHLIILCSKNF